MKKSFLIILATFFSITIYAQNAQNKPSTDSITVESRIEFFIYDGPYGEMENLKKPAIKFILTVKNKGTKPIPDIGVANRSLYVNLIINDSVQNPVSLYNGIEIVGDHLLNKNESDTYTWWIFEEDAYNEVFTMQWQYMDMFTKKTKINVVKKTIEVVK
ncbi:MAG: hypothetical protein ABIJ97_09265 [Bacteroidota bacterium]